MGVSNPVSVGYTIYGDKYCAIPYLVIYVYNNVAKQELKHVVNSCEQNICKIGMCIFKKLKIEDCTVVNFIMHVYR